MKLSGDLQSQQVRELWQQRDSWWQDDSMDLAAVTSLDPAGVALMVKWALAAAGVERPLA